MPRFEFIRPRPVSRTITFSEVARISDSLRRGELAVLPTETGYMLAALATSIPAVERAFAVKFRNHAQVMHVACASLAMAAEVGELTPQALRLLGEFTPGPMSVVVPKTALLPDRLVTMDGTVGIRVPDHPATLQVISEVGTPLTATSLNVSGTAPALLKELELESLNWPVGEMVHVVADDDSISYQTGSTLVRATGPDVEILRAGPVTESQVREVATRTSYLEAARA
jgi:L-threonylcarbamoyladenylate synthase